MIDCVMEKIPVKKSYFYNMASIMPQLESLNLSGCKWFEDHSLMAIRSDRVAFLFNLPDGIYLHRCIHVYLFHSVLASAPN